MTSTTVGALCDDLKAEARLNEKLGARQVKEVEKEGIRQETEGKGWWRRSLGVPSHGIRILIDFLTLIKHLLIHKPMCLSLCVWSSFFMHRDCPYVS